MSTSSSHTLAHEPRVSRTATRKPSSLLALVAAAIVAAYDSSWLKESVCELASRLGERPERISRLKAKALAAFESILRRISRPGRPPTRPPERSEPRVKVLEALLAVAADVFSHHPIRKREIQDRLVAARDRLKTEHGVNHEAFCETLGLPPRTVRNWAARPPSPTAEPEPPEPGVKKGDSNEGRFALEVTLPGIQAMADTTNWGLFQEPLKVVAIQDPGDRDRKLLEAAAVEDHEDKEVVIRVVEEALANRPGTQLLTDQGTPYLAEAAQQAYERLELEHAPQKEACPTEKAPLERAFRTIKDALEPLAKLTHQLADAVPALKNPALARSAGQLLLAVFLRVYLFAAKTPEVDRPSNRTILRALAEEQREKGRAEGRSVRLRLEQIHRAYDFPGSIKKFRRAHRHRRIEDIVEAERRMGVRACRCHARRCDRYFAAILARVAEENGRRRKRDRQNTIEFEERRELRRRFERVQQERRDHPEDWIVYALDLVAVPYNSKPGRLAAAGVSLGRNELRRALNQLRSYSPLSARDRAEVAWKRWLEHHSQKWPAAVPRVRRLFELTLDDLLAGDVPTAEDAANAMLQREGDGEGEHAAPPPEP